jgi:hypothetical protein
MARKIGVRMQLVGEKVEIATADGKITLSIQELEDVIDQLCHFQWLGRAKRLEEG